MTDTAVHPYASHAPVFNVESQTEGALARDLLRLDVEEGLLGLRTLVAHFHAVGPDSDGSDEQLSYLDGEIVDLGKTIAAMIGPPGGERQIFEGVVSAVEASFEEGRIPIVSVYAEDALMGLRLRERTATYVDMSDADIVGEIADDHGLDADATVDGPTYSVVQQFEQSDLAFLRDRAARLNAEVWIEDDVLRFSDRERRDGVEIQLVQGNELIAAHVRADLAHQRTEVVYRGWDHAGVVAVDGTADSSTVMTEIDGGRTGVEIVADIFTESARSRARRDAYTAEIAQSYADADMLRRARNFVTVDGTTSGTPDLVPGAKLTLHRVGRPFDGDGYRVTSVHHTYDLDSGHRTHFSAERSAVAR